MLTLEKVNKSVSGVFKHPAFLMIIRIGLVLVLVFMYKIHRKALSVFENVYFQVFYLVLMAYVALLDAPSALLMAAVYLFAIQQLNKSAPTKHIPVSNIVVDDGVGVNVNGSDKMQKLLNIQQMDMDERMKVRTQMINSDIARASEIPPLNKANDLKTQELMMNTVEPFDTDANPAFKTLTENIASDKNSGMFTTPQQFLDAQTNELTGIKQNEGIKVWENQFTAQGLDLPHGFDPEEYKAMSI
jgi:hypothetical protein